MSAESSEWLNRRTLIGNTSKRGVAWHYREEHQGDESNHYPGPIPAEDVIRRLFDWEPTRADITATVITSDNLTVITDPDRVGIVRPSGSFGSEDPGALLGVFKSGYKVHGYSEWLVSNLDLITDGGLDIGSAGLLTGGARAWVQAEQSETLSIGDTGVEARPFITAATSCDGSLATTYQTGAQLVVCDNTLSAAMRESGANRVKIKHTSGSLKGVGAIRDALGLIETVAEAFSAEVIEQCHTEFAGKDWARFLDIWAGMVDDKGARRDLKGAALTRAQKSRDELAGMALHDNRVSPWAGTVFGARQAVNTYYHHLQPAQKGTDRATRNLDRMITGQWDSIDAEVLFTCEAILAGTA